MVFTNYIRNIYWSIGMSVFLSVNSIESKTFGFCIPQRIVQLPPVWSNETLECSMGKTGVVTDMGTGGN
jgi:hypothetical protein